MDHTTPTTTTTTDQRRRNLRILIREAEDCSRFAARLDLTGVDLLQMAGGHGRARIGSRLARDMEHRLGLERGWLDLRHEYLPDPVRTMAVKWLLLPEALRREISNYMDLQFESCSAESRGDGAQPEDTDLEQIYHEARG